MGTPSNPFAQKMINNPSQKKARKSHSLFFLCILLCSCQGSSQKGVEITKTKELPAPPYSDLTNTSIGLYDDAPISTPGATLKDTISSIKKLQAYKDRSSYRTHLEELATEVFQKVATQNNPDAVIMTLMASTACHHPISNCLSKELVRSPHPIIQLCAVQALAQINTSQADTILCEALRSEYPMIRLEAAYKIACKRSKDSFFHLDALSYKLPEPLLPFMPELFAIEGSVGSIHRLQQFLYDKNEEVVIHTLLAIGEQHLTSYSDKLLAMNPHSPAVLEALAFALRTADQKSAIDKLRKMLCHQNSCVQIQAALSLIFLGDTSQQAHILRLANTGDLFAIEALSECPNADFFSLTTQKSKAFALNKAIAMLEQKDASCIEDIKKILSFDDDTALYRSPSNGYTRTYWDAAPLASFDKDQRPLLYEQSLSCKESILAQTLELHEQAFFDLASYIFENRLVPLYPCLIDLLQNQESESGIELLQMESQRIGAPYNRTFAKLALYRLGVERDETCLGQILDFARQKDDRPWRFPVPWASFTRQEDRGKEQQTNANARLYIDALQALAQSSSEKSISLLVSELDKAPTPYIPFVCAALLQATM